MKVWDIECDKSETPKIVHKLECLGKDYIRSCKLVDNKILIVGGESSSVRLFDMEAPGNDCRFKQTKTTQINTFRWSKAIG